MRAKKIVLALLISMFMLVSAPAFALLDASQMVDYPYGQQYTGMTASQMASYLNGKYNSWKASYITSSGAGGYQRVNSPESIQGYSNCTVSEGIGYGMILAVYFNDQTLFDNLWNYKELHQSFSGLMNWLIDSNGTVRGSGSATDGDADIAFALLKAYERWGSTTYLVNANSEIASMENNDVAGDNSLKPGDSWDNYEFPSYFTPAYYRDFANYRPSAAAKWNAVTSTCLSHYSAAANSTSGLVAEHILGGTDTTQYKYNSCRVPWRYAMDYVWNGDSGSQGMVTKLANFFNNTVGSPGAVRDCYNVSNGSSCGSNNNSAFVGPAATAMMVSGAYPLSTWFSATGGFGIPETYYNSSLNVLSLLLMSGFMPESFSSTGPTNTNTPTGPTHTPTQTNTPGGETPMLDDMDDGDNMSNWGGFWYTFDDYGLTTTTPSGPGDSIVWPPSENYAVDPVFEMSAPGYGGAGYAARMTGNVTDTYEYGFVGMGIALTEPKGPIDFSSCTGIRFDYKGAGEQYRIKLTSSHPDFVDGEGDNHYGNVLTTLATWQSADLSLNDVTFTQEPYWGSAVTFADAMTMVTDIQFQTVGQPVAVDLWIDNLEVYGCSSYPTPIPQATDTPGGPTNTNTNTPTETNTLDPAAATATHTNTPSAAAGVLDDMEDGDNGSNWGGYWYTFDDYGLTTTTPSGPGDSIVWPPSENYAVDPVFEMSAPGAGGSAYCARMTGNVTDTYEYGFVGMGVALTEPKAPVDMSSCTGIKFDYTGAGEQYRIKLTSAHPDFVDGEGDNHYGNVITTLNGVWQSADLALNDVIFTQEPYWGSTVTFADAMTMLTDVQFQTVGQPVAVDLSIDNLEFYGCSSYPTPAPIATDTPGGPTNTNTNTPTETNTLDPAADTPTQTNTPSAAAGVLDDMEDGDNGSNWGGYWYTFDDYGLTTTTPSGPGDSIVWPPSENYAVDPVFEMSAPGAGGSAYCARMTGNVTDTYEYGFVGMGVALTEPKAPVDMSSCTGIKFDYTGAGEQYRIKLTSAHPDFVDGEGDNHYGNVITTLNGVWQSADLALNDVMFTQEPYWGSTVTFADAMTMLTDVQFQTVGQPVAVDLSIDNLEFYGCSSYPTPAPIMTDTPSGDTPTNTNTPTETNTIDITADTPTETNTPSAAAGIVDDMEDGNNASNWGGYWYTFDDYGLTTTTPSGPGDSIVWPPSENYAVNPEFEMSAPGFGGSAYCARMTGNVTDTYEYGFVGMGIALTEPKSPVDMSSCTGIKFDYTGAGEQYRIKLTSAHPDFVDGEGDNHYGNVITTLNGVWQSADLALNDVMFTQEPYWGSTVSFADAMTMLTDVQFQTVGQPVAVDLSIDNLEFYGCSSYPTPAPIMTDTPSGDTPTNTNTPTETNTIDITADTPTETNTPSAAAGILDDMEDGNNASNWGGYWYTFDDYGLTTTTPSGPGDSIVWPPSENYAVNPEFEMSAPGAGGSAYCARITGNVTDTYEYGFVGMGVALTEPKAPVDMSSCTGIKFDYTGAGEQYRIKLTSAHPDFVDGEGDNHYGNVITTLNGVWQSADLALNDVMFTQEPYWGSTVSFADAMTMLTDVQFQTVGQPVAVDLSIDNLEFYGCSSYPTPAPTATAGGDTATETPIPVDTNTPTETNTIDITADTPTQTPTQDPATAGLVDDMEDGNNASNWGGYWYTFDDYGQTTTTPSGPGDSIVWPPSENYAVNPEFEMSAPGAGGSAYCARMTGNVTDTYEYGFVGMGIALTEPKSPVDMSSCTGIKFDYTGAGEQYRIKLTSAHPGFVDGEGDNHYGHVITTLNGVWQSADLALNDVIFTQEPYWGSTVTFADAMTMLTDVQFQTVGQPVPVDLSIDNLEFYGCSSYPTPAPTSTVGGDTPTETETTGINTPTETETIDPMLDTPTETHTGLPWSTDTATPTPTIYVDVTSVLPGSSGSIDVGVTTDTTVYFSNNQDIVAVMVAIVDGSGNTLGGTSQNGRALISGALPAGTNNITVPLDDAATGLDLEALDPASGTYTLRVIVVTSGGAMSMDTIPVTVTGMPTITETQTPAISNTPTETHTITYTYTFTDTYTPTQTNTPTGPTATPTNTPYDDPNMNLQIVNVSPASVDTDNAITENISVDITFDKNVSMYNVNILEIGPGGERNTVLSNVAFGLSSWSPGSQSITILETAIGSLPAGNYYIQVIVNDIDPANRDTAVSSTSFTVQNLSNPTYTPSPTPTEGAGEDTVEDPLPYPNPSNPDIDGIRISFKISKHAESVTFKLYTSASRLIRQVEVPAAEVYGGLRNEQNTMHVPAKYFEGVAKGIYYYVLIVNPIDGEPMKSKVDKIIIMR